MRKLAFIIAVAALFGLCDSTAGQSIATTAPELGPQDGVLLLTNGQTLAGKVTRAGDHYFVVLPNGEIRLRTQEVELFCRTLDEGYERKRSSLMPGDIAAHLDLADWCVRNLLFGYAAEQLAQARALDATQPRIGLIERRIQLARERHADEPAAREAAPAGPTNDELDRLVRGLPSGAVDHFAGVIQPLLLNHCTNSGCHGPNSATKFSLMRIPLGRTPSRRLTQRNLYATLQHVDRTRPSESPLVAAVLGPHGGSKTPIFTGRDIIQYQHLVAWVQRLAQGQPAPAMETSTQAKSVENRPGVLLQTLQPREAITSDGGSGIDSSTQGPPTSLPVPPANNSGLSATGGSFVPRDPLDPEIFNRRYFPDSP